MDEAAKSARQQQLVEGEARVRLYLPYEYDLIGLMRPGNNRTFVAVARDHVYLPFCAYEVGLDGGCVSGHYFDKRSDALTDMTRRALRSVGAEAF